MFFSILKAHGTSSMVTETPRVFKSLLWCSIRTVKCCLCSIYFVENNLKLKVLWCCFFCVQGTVASTASCIQLHKRAERVAVALMEKGRLNIGDHVALVYPPGKAVQTAKLKGRHCKKQLFPRQSIQASI